jgi:hypothetical protein
MNFEDLKTELQDGMDRFNRWLADFIEKTKKYFSQLDQQEQYAWGAEGIGFLTFVTGIVLLIL